MATKKLDEFVQGLLDKFSAIITDEVFLLIETDRELLFEYLHLVAATGNVSEVNAEIAKAIKKRFHLTTTHEPNQEPESLLIQSFVELQ